MFKKRKEETKYNYVTVLNKCKDCWYWKEDKEESLTTEFGTIEMGECSCLEVYDFIWWKGDRDKTDVETCELFTHESFGCRSWTKEEPY